MAKKNRVQAILESPFVRDEDLRGLNWSELNVLKDRGKLTEKQERAVGFRPNPPYGGVPVPENFGIYGAESEEDEAPDDDSYASWTNRQLREEIDSRNEMRDSDNQLPRSGNKEELIAALEADDEETEDE